MGIISRGPAGVAIVYPYQDSVHHHLIYSYPRHFVNITSEPRALWERSLGRFSPISRMAANAAYHAQPSVPAPVLNPEWQPNSLIIINVYQ